MMGNIATRANLIKNVIKKKEKIFFFSNAIYLTTASDVDFDGDENENWKVNSWLFI